MSGVIWMVVKDQATDVWMTEGKTLRQVVRDHPISTETSPGLSEQLNRAGVKAWPVIVSPSGCDCFFSVMESDPAGNETTGGGISRSVDVAALTYELESHLPMDAEFTAADFIERGDGAIAAVAVDSRRMVRTLESLESIGSVPVAVIPKTMLIVRGWLEASASRERWTGRLWLVGPHHAEAVEISEGTVVAWKWLPESNDATIKQYLCLHPLAGPQHVLVDDTTAPDSTSSDLPSEPDNAGPAAPIPSSLASLDQTTATSILNPSIQAHARSNHGAWWNLQTGPLAPADPMWAIRRPLRTAAIAIAGLIAAVWLAGWYRGNRIESEIAELSDLQRTTFAETFPGRRIPAATLRSVRSEYTRSLGSRALASSGPGDGLDLPISSADILRRLLASLPPEIRFRINRIDISDDDLTIDLQVTRPVDAGTIATSLTEMGFDVNPPVTSQKDSQTYDSTIEAKFAGTLKLASNPSRGTNP